MSHSLALFRAPYRLAFTPPMRHRIYLSTRVHRIATEDRPQESRPRDRCNLDVSIRTAVHLPRLLANLVITFSILRIPTGHRRLRPAAALEFKNTRPPFSVLSVPNASRERTTYDPTCEHIPTSGRLFVLCVARHLRDNTIESATKVFILGRRNLCAKENFTRRRISSGAVDDDLQGQMLLVGISDLRRDEFASSLCWKKSGWIGKTES